MDVAFKDLPSKLQSRLKELRADGTTLKGGNGEKDAEAFFARKNPKTRRQWNSMRFYLMMRIDNARKKQGLAAVHFK